MIRKVKTRFVGNPCRSDRKIARVLNTSREQIQRMLKNKLGLKPLKFQKVQELTDGKKKVILERARELLRLHEKWSVTEFVFFFFFFFFDEKPFQIEQFVD